MNWRRFLPDWLVIYRYVQSGSNLGDAESYSFMGECIAYDRLMKRWEAWEAEYARRGYRPLSLFDFIDHGGYGVPLSGIGQKLSPEENVILHAKVWREVKLKNREVRRSASAANRTEGVA